MNLFQVGQSCFYSAHHDASSRKDPNQAEENIQASIAAGKKRRGGGGVVLLVTFKMLNCKIQLFLNYYFHPIKLGLQIVLSLQSKAEIEIDRKGNNTGIQP